LTDERSLRNVVRRTLLVPFQDSGETMLRTLTMTAALAAAALAQSPLTTTYAAGNGLGAGATIYFDVVVAVPLTFTQFDINSSSAAQTSGSIDVRWCNNTYVGNDTNAAAWTLGGSGRVGRVARSGSPRGEAWRCRRRSWRNWTGWGGFQDS
jgi:hypothetical protein